jgi:hypothetical protein
MSSFLVASRSNDKEFVMHLIHATTAEQDAFQEAVSLSSKLPDGMGMRGFGVAHLFDGDGKTKQLVPFANLITTAGDQYYCQKGIVGIAPAAPSAPTAANGMKLGTTATAAAKSSTGSLLVAYLTASNIAFDSTYPSSAAVGGDAGWNATYKTTWAPGVATSTTINEVVIVNDQASNATSTAANTYSRAVVSTVNKGASDTLAITWVHKFLGA